MDDIAIDQANVLRYFSIMVLIADALELTSERIG